MKNVFVPDVMFTTIEPPVDQLLMVGRGCVLQAKVVRLKKDLKGEHNAKEISDALPFIEYEIHRQLINKLKVKGELLPFFLRIYQKIMFLRIPKTMSNFSRAYFTHILLKPTWQYNVSLTLKSCAGSPEDPDLG